jgi:hypothetical protein
MTHPIQARKRGGRRVATLLAALGMLVMSSGVALMVTSTSANAAADKVGICHATSSDSNPYVFISVDANSAKLQGHLMHRNDPNKRWKTDGYFSGVHHVAGQLKPDLIGSFTDTHGVFHLYDGTITEASCVNTPLVATASVNFVDPTCANQNSTSYSTSGTHATFSLLSGTVAPGNSVVVRATADGGSAFAGNKTILDFPHTFGAALNLSGPPCVIEGPPNQVTPAAPTFTDPTCDTGPSYTLPTAAPVNPVTRKAAGPELQTKDVDGVHYVVTGYLVAGGTVDVDATAIPPNVLASGVTTHWQHTFTTPTGCGAVTPPVVTPPVVTPPDVTPPSSTVVTPTLVHAGLISTVTPDLRGQRGLALLVAGFLLLVAGGGLGLIRPGGQARR